MDKLGVEGNKFKKIHKTLQGNTFKLEATGAETTGGNVLVLLHLGGPLVTIINAMAWGGEDEYAC